MKLLIAFAIAFLIFQVQTIVYRRYWNQDLKASMSFEREILYEGQKNKLIEVIENRKRLPLPMLQVKFSITRTFLFEQQTGSKVTDKYYRSEFFTVMPWQKITRTYPIVCSKRGYYTTENIDLICPSFFLTEKMIETKSDPVSVCVLPGRIRHKEVPDTVNTLLGETEKNLRINEDPFTFAGIRDYQPYDNIRSINWKATARHGNLLVNTHNTTFSKRVILLLNIDANSMLHTSEIAEWAIRIASHLAAFYISARIPTAMYTNGKSILGCPAIDAGADLSHVRAIEMALARIDTSLPTESFLQLMDDRIKVSRQPAEYMIISNYRRKDITDKYESLRSQGVGIHFIIPSYIGETVEDSFRAPLYTDWATQIE